MAVRQHRRGKIAFAMREPLGQHMALERGVLVREQIVDIARRDPKRGSGGREREFGVGEVGANMRLEPIPSSASQPPPPRSGSRRATSTTCSRTRAPRSSAMCSASGWRIASAICRRRCWRIAMSAKSPSTGGSTTCRISAACSASITACRPGTGGRASCPINDTAPAARRNSDRYFKKFAPD